MLNAIGREFAEGQAVELRGRPLLRNLVFGREFAGLPQIVKPLALSGAVLQIVKKAVYQFFAMSSTPSRRRCLTSFDAQIAPSAKTEYS